MDSNWFQKGHAIYRSKILVSDKANNDLPNEIFSGVIQIR